jgi:hypothetical protein
MDGGFRFSALTTRRWCLENRLIGCPLPGKKCSRFKPDRSALHNLVEPDLCGKPAFTFPDHALVIAGRQRQLLRRGGRVAEGGGLLNRYTV